MLQISVLKEDIAKEKDGGGGAAKPNKDCMLTAFGAMLSTTVPPPTIARNTALHIATGGRCGMCQQAIIIKVQTVVIVNNSFILLRFKKNIDHKCK